MNELIIPVRDLTLARKLASYFEGSYHSVESKKGMKILDGYPEQLRKINIHNNHIARGNTEIKYFVKIQNGLDLRNAEIGDFVIMCGSGSYTPSNNNPYGILGVVRERRLTGIRVSWSNGQSNNGYTFVRDIIPLPVDVFQ